MQFEALSCLYEWDVVFVASSMKMAAGCSFLLKHFTYRSTGRMI